MQVFTINENVSVVCEWKKTRTAFKHEASLVINGREVERVKICYLNRTWERYEFESVLYKLQEKTAKHTGEDVAGLFLEKIKSNWAEEAQQAIKTH